MWQFTNRQFRASAWAQCEGKRSMASRIGREASRTGLHMERLRKCRDLRCRPTPRGWALGGYT